MMITLYFRVTVLAAMALLLSSLMSAQVTLQKWTEVFGTIVGQNLGLETQGIVPTSNLPYKASIHSFGYTGFYMLRTPNDTTAQGVFFGNNILTGDLNNDGWKDVVIHRGGTSTTVETVLVFRGTATGIDTLNPLRLLGENPSDGFQPGCIGDVNNDGYRDLIIGAIGYPYPYGWGKLYFFFGPDISSIPDRVLVGDTISFHLGSKCRVGDLNNDGRNDLIVQGQVSFPSGNYKYLRVFWGLPDSLNLINRTEIRGSTNAAGGLACFDANGDGIADLLWTNRDSLDWIYVHYGGSAFDTIPNLKLRDPQFAVFGRSIVNGGDMNGDGYDDVVVAAPVSNNPGFVYVYGGGPRIDQYFDAAVGMTALSYFGYSVSSVGDVTGDGLSDIIVGAPNYEFGDQRGYWGIFKGDSTIRVTDVKEMLSASPAIFTLHQAYPNPFNPSATIPYQLQVAAHVRLEVFNTLGQLITVLRNELQYPGTYEATVDASTLSSGVYFCRLTAQTGNGTIYSDTKKMTLIR